MQITYINIEYETSTHCSLVQSGIIHTNIGLATLPALSIWCGNDELIFISYCYDREPSHHRIANAAAEMTIKECNIRIPLHMDGRWAMGEGRCDIQRRNYYYCIYMTTLIVQARTHTEYMFGNDEQECYRRFVFDSSIYPSRHDDESNRIVQKQ